MIRSIHKIILAVTLVSLIVPVCAPQTAVAAFDPNGTDVLSGCSGGHCAAPGAAAGTIAGKSPVNTVPSGGVDANVTNPSIAVGGRALNSISGSTAGTLLQKKFEWAQTFVLEALKKRILDMMVDEIINWVKGNGDPKFVTDWQGFLRDAGNVALGNFATQVAGAGICQPFKNSILNSLKIPESKPFSSGSLYGSNITCTLDEIVDNIDGFYSDFRNGGWEAYLSSWQTQNNPATVRILTDNTKYVAISNAANAAQLEGVTGDGFLSTKSCDEDPTSNGPDIDHDKIKGDIASTCRITTPGTIVGDYVKEAVGADFKYITSADQLAAYVAAISDALFNRLIREGVGGLQGLTTKNSPDGGSLAPSGPGCNSFPLGSTARDACLGYFSSNNGNFSATREDLLADIKTVRDGLTELRDALADWKQVADDLNTFITSESENQSDQCISGALDQYFTPPTPAGVTAFAASIGLQIETVDARIASLDSYQSQLETLPADNWAEFTSLASTVQSQLMSTQAPEGAVDAVLIQKLDLRNASDDIHQRISICSHAF